MRLLVIAILLFTLAGASLAQQHGEVLDSQHGQVQVWNGDKKSWSDIETFWLTFANSNDAKYWGKTDSYPTYSDVNEFDTLLIKVDKGTCLMQFFHARWRRANDVQRWDDAFNEYSGCPYVFD